MGDGGSLLRWRTAASEKTVGNILKMARERLAQQRDAEQRAAQPRNSRRVAALAWRDQRVLVPGVDLTEAVLKLAEAFAAKSWKFEAKDLTPELAEFADAYLRAAHADSATYHLGDNDGWLRRCRHRVTSRAGELPGIPAGFQ